MERTHQTDLLEVKTNNANKFNDDTDGEESSKVSQDFGRGNTVSKSQDLNIV